MDMKDTFSLHTKTQLVSDFVLGPSQKISLTRMLLRNLLAIANLLVVNRRSFIVAAEAVFLGM